MVDNYRISYKDVTPFMIDIGCGTNKHAACIGIDIEDFGQELLWDVHNGLPFKDNSVDAIFSSHFFEHLTIPQLEQLLYECRRVLKSGGMMAIRVPSSKHVTSRMPCHYIYWDEMMVQGICCWLPANEGVFTCTSCVDNGIEFGFYLTITK